MELSTHIWELKAKSIGIWLQVLALAMVAHGNWVYDLTEKLTRAKAEPSSLLKALDEFTCQCRHMNKFTLKSYKISQ